MALDTTSEIAYAIRRAVVARGLKPGDRIGTEHELATRYGVSRPTVREALRLLAGAHLIRATQGRGGGIFVAGTPDEGLGRNLSDSIATMLATESVSLPELAEARMVLEVPLAGLAAQRATPELVAELEAAVGADARFHQAIIAAGNDLLVALARWILDVLLPRVMPQREDVVAQHRAILDAIRRGDREAAERAMREHLDPVLTDHA